MLADEPVKEALFGDPPPKGRPRKKHSSDTPTSPKMRELRERYLAEHAKNKKDSPSGDD